MGLGGLNLSTDLLVGADRARLERVRERSDRASCSCLLLIESEAQAFGATELCIQSGIHPDWALEDYLQWLRVARDEGLRHGADLHLHAYSPMEIAHMAQTSGLSDAEVFARLRDAGLDSTTGTAAEILHDDVRARISVNKLTAARWVEVIEASHRSGLRSTATVMFGHIERPEHLARHMVVVRELAHTGQCGTPMRAYSRRR